MGNSNELQREIDLLTFIEMNGIEKANFAQSNPTRATVYGIFSEHLEREILPGAMVRPEIFSDDNEPPDESKVRAQLFTDPEKAKRYAQRIRKSVREKGIKCSVRTFHRNLWVNRLSIPVTIIVERISE